MHPSIDLAGGSAVPPDFAPRYPPQRVLRLRRHIVSPGPDRWRLVSVGTAEPPPTPRPPTVTHAEVHRVLRALNAMTACASRLQAERDDWAARCHGALELAAAAHDEADAAGERERAATDDAAALTAGFAWLWWVMIGQVVLSVLVLAWQGARAMGWVA